MKKIIILLLLFSGVVFAQNADERTNQASTAQTLHDVYEATTDLLRIRVVTSSSSTGGYGKNTITTLDTLYASDDGTYPDCKKGMLTNFTSGEIIYVGFDASVTTSNGYPLQYLDDFPFTINSLSKIFIATDGTAVDVRFTYEN